MLSRYLTHSKPVDSGVSLEAGYWQSTTAYIASHCRLLNLAFKTVVVVVVISSTEMGRNNYESLYFILEFTAVQPPTYYLWPSTKKINETHVDSVFMPMTMASKWFRVSYL